MRETASQAPSPATLAELGRIHSELARQDGADLKTIGELLSRRAPLLPALTALARQGATAPNRQILRQAQLDSLTVTRKLLLYRLLVAQKLTRLDQEKHAIRAFKVARYSTPGLLITSA